MRQGDEPIDVPFIEWDWARMGLASGHAAVVYDVRQKQAPDRVLALRFAPDGGVEQFDAPPRHLLPRTLWRLAPTMRSETAPMRRQWLEDTPFYARAVLDARVCGQPVVAMHETLDVGRLATRAVRRTHPVDPSRSLG